MAEGALISLGVTAGASAKDASIHKKMFGSGPLSTPRMTIIIISNEKMHDIMKVVKPLKESKLLIKWVSETIKIEAKVLKGGFSSISLSTLGASLLGNLLTGKGTIKAGEGTIRAGQAF